MEKIVDELCICGHLMSVHDAADHGVCAVSGHGACKCCECSKFTWARFITQDEMVFYARME